MKKKIVILLCTILTAISTYVVSAEDNTPKFPTFDIQPAYSDVVVDTVKLDLMDDKRELRMNIYKPEGHDEPTPVVIWVHGGKWCEGDYSNERQVKGLVENGNFLSCMSTLDLGCTVVTADYRLSQEALYPAMVWDLKGQIRFLRANAEKYNIDPDRIIVWGESAGGHLVNLLGTTDGIEELEGDVGGNLEYSSKPTAVIDYFGMTDILELAPDQYERPYIISAKDMYDQVDAAESTRSQLLGFNGEGEGIGVLRANLGNPGNPYENPDSPYQDALHRAYLSCPLNFVTKDDCPFFISQGGQDYRVAVNQSVRLFEELTKSGVEAYMFADTLKGHGTQGSFADDAAFRFICDQFNIESNKGL
ncbi:MAG: alpha/beta hydrolase [Eubacteriales bacterium]|nr:alpha/beta hydrolase [Eubacteriales bacterium]